MHILIHPTCFPTIATFIAIAKAESVTIEMHDNFQKQTYRNRYYIYAANGKLQLNIPVIYSQKNRKKYSEVQIANNYQWQLNHWKSLESAYRTSPFFEFYCDELEPLFKEPFETLMAFNLKCFETICDCIQLEVTLKKTETFEHTSNNLKDYRGLVNAKKEPVFNIETYTQVFEAKHGYINNLSILDLLFNQGPNTLNFLESQKSP